MTGSAAGGPDDMTATDEQIMTAPEIPVEAPPEKKEGKIAGLVTKIRGNPVLLWGLVVLVLLGITGGVLYWNDLQSKVYVENSQITAPVIPIGPTSSGIIEELYVSVGDHVRKDQTLAKVGDEVLVAKTDGIITGVENTPGHSVNPLRDATPVITMIDPRELRVNGRVQEDKGLKDIAPGQHVEFTVDAFPSNRYVGVVEKIAPSSRVGDIVFSISDKRQEQEFDVTVIYDITAYPELKNGMSAKMWIFK